MVNSFESIFLCYLCVLCKIIINGAYIFCVISSCETKRFIYYTFSLAKYVYTIWHNSLHSNSTIIYSYIFANKRCI